MMHALVAGLSRQIALRHTLDVVANNVANLGTTGFRAVKSDYREAPPASARTSAQARGVSAVLAAGERIETAAGPIERTGESTHVAIRGDGFFSIQTARGERFTRDGAFAVDARGRLVNAAGDPVLGQGGPITVGAATRVEIARDGSVSTENGVVGRLRLTRFPAGSAPSPDGGGAYLAGAGGTPATEATLETGALERSNVDAVSEMTRLVEVNRAYAGVTSAMERIDDMRRAAVERLGADLRA